MSDLDSSDAEDLAVSMMVDPFERLEGERRERLLKYNEVSKQPDYVEKLVAAGASYSNQVVLQEGDLVQWKPNMKDGRLPEYTRPAVYLGPREPASRICKCGRHFDDELDDVYFGVLDEDLDFRIYTTDSRRLMKYARSDECE